MTTCEKCGDEREEITGLLCYRCRCGMQEWEMQELRAENERLTTHIVNYRTAAKVADGVIDRLTYQRKNLAMMVGRLVRLARLAPIQSKTPDQALGLLKRWALLPSPLRTEEVSDE